MKKTIIKVDGIQCSHCENRIKNSLNRIEGILHVLASSDDGEVIVEYEDSLKIEDIKKKIEDLGFEVK